MSDIGTITDDGRIVAANGMLIAHGSIWILRDTLAEAERKGWIVTQDAGDLIAVHKPDPFEGLRL